MLIFKTTNMKSRLLILIVIHLQLTAFATIDTTASPVPNILFCIADDASWQQMSAYGLCKWVQTPSFDRIANEGLLFMNAYTPNAKCAPSRASILTGRNPWQLEAAGNHNPFFPSKFKTFMEVFTEHGYITGFTGKGWGPGEVGTDKYGQKRMLTGREYNAKKLTAPTSGISAIDYAANLDEFLRNKKSGQPFMFWYGGMEPHREYEYGSGIHKGRKKLSDIDSVPPFWIDNDVTRTDMLDYAYEVEYFDFQLGKVLEVLKKHNQLENTIIIVTSDNGMPFPRIKGHMYEYDNHLPLAIMWKGHISNPGRKIYDYISFIDFAPTFLEAAHIRQLQTGMQPIQGRSMLSIIKSKDGSYIDTTRDYVLLGRERTDVGRPHDEGYPQRAIVKDGFFFVKNYEPSRWPSGNPETGYMDTDGSPAKTEILSANRRHAHEDLWQMNFGKRPSQELYKIKNDPWQMNNLAGNKIYGATQKTLLKFMESNLKKQGDPRMFGKGDVFDKYPYAPQQVRGFYERYMKGEKMPTNWIQPTDFEKQMNNN